MTVATVLFLILGFVLLVWGAELMVRGSANLATSFGISPLVVGLTVVAFGTSAPELAVSVMSAYKGQPDLALGNVVGSNLFNVLLILGISAVIVPLVVAQQLVRFDVPVMIFVSFLLYLFGMDGNISRLDGIVLFSGAIGYTVFLIRQSRRETNEEVRAEYEYEFSASKRSGPLKNIFFVLLGLGGLMLGSRWLVDSAVAIARAFDVSELIIGLTVVAAGTSMPEVATSVVAAVRGERDIAVGNVVGSNIFNIVCVLGLSSIVSPAGIAVLPAALRFDIPVMIAVAVACLPIFFSGYQITRANGVAFLAFYAAYIVYLFLSATDHDLLPSYQMAMKWFVFPITTLSLVLIGIHGFLKKQGAA